jgi:hypothetical protein
MGEIKSSLLWLQHPTRS